jgi:hypothetical protein
VLCPDQHEKKDRAVKATATPTVSLWRNRDYLLLWGGRARASSGGDEPGSGNSGYHQSHRAVSGRCSVRDGSGAALQLLVCRIGATTYCLLARGQQHGASLDSALCARSALSGSSSLGAHRRHHLFCRRADGDSARDQWKETLDKSLDNSSSMCATAGIRDIVCDTLGSRGYPADSDDRSACPQQGGPLLPTCQLTE